MAEPMVVAKLGVEGGGITIRGTRADGRSLEMYTDQDPRPWPELAEYDCFACHQNLRPGWEPPPSGEPAPAGLPANSAKADPRV